MKTVRLFIMMMLLAGLASINTGCAVLTIDVDVYKGPLSNHRDMQTQQVVVMAIGAKPLLIELRDRMEWKTAEGVKEGRRNAGKWYREGFVDPDGHKSRFENGEAKRINDILGLYENASAAGLNLLVREGEEAMQRGGNYAEKVFRRPQDQSFWDEISKNLIHEKADMATNPKLKDFDDGAKTSAATAVNNLREAYKALLNPVKDQWRDSRSFLSAHLKLESSLEGKTELPSDLPTVNSGDNKSMSANQRFELLRDKDLVEFHANYLFKGGKEDPAAKQFVKRVTEIGDAYILAREEIQQGIRLGLDFIELVNASPQADNLQNKRMLTRTAAEIVARLIQPKALLLAVTNVDSPDSARAFIYKHWVWPLHDDLYNLNKWKLGDYDIADNVLAKLIEEKPEKSARHLRDLHSALVRAKDDSIEMKYEQVQLTNGEQLAKYKKKAWRRFGLARGPVDGGDGEKLQQALKRTTSQLDQLANDLGGSLSGGRLDEGIETLVRQFLVKHYQDKDSDAIDHARTQLLHSLVRFSEKVLVIANNQTLFLDGEKSDRASLLTYAMVLQSVGNSIQTQVNDIRQHEQYDKNNQDKWETELAAVKAVLPAGDDYLKPFNEVINDGSVEDKDKDPRAVIDRMIATLQYDFAIEVKKNGEPDASDAKTAKARKLADALEVLEAQRAGMVFIRPASSYLRSSTPATGLQDKPPLAWENMLGEHGLRMIPFHKEADRSMPYEDYKKLERARADIDKQFWQRVNRVRVAAAGRSNYVIAKDDIGNWYIKGFEGDPRPIIKAAKQMALFAARSGLSVPPVGSNGAGVAAGANMGDAVTNAASSTPNAQSSTRQAKVSKAIAEHRKAAAEDLKTIHTLADADDAKGLRKRITGRLAVDSQTKKREYLDRLKPAVEGISIEGLPSIPDKPGEDAEVTDKVVASLKALARYHENLTVAIKKLKLGDGTDVANKEKAKAALDEKLKEQENILKLANAVLVEAEPALKQAEQLATILEADAAEKQGLVAAATAAESPTAVVLKAEAAEATKKAMAARDAVGKANERVDQAKKDADTAKNEIDKMSKKDGSIDLAEGALEEAKRNQASGLAAEQRALITVTDMIAVKLKPLVAQRKLRAASHESMLHIMRGDP